MATVNLGNVVGLLKSETPPSKTYVIWAKILNPSFPNTVELYYWDNIAGAWTPLTDSTTQYWLRPVISYQITTPPVTPVEGDRYLIPAGATGVWATHIDKVATFKTGVWQYQVPLDGYIVSARDQANLLYDYRGVYGLGGVWAVNDFQVPIAPGTYIPATEKGAPLGVATLDSSSQVPAAQINGPTLPFSPATPSDWPPGTDTLWEALEYLKTIAPVGLPAGLMIAVGQHDASGGLFPQPPAQLGTGPGGAIKAGNLWDLNVGGILLDEDENPIPVPKWATARARIDTPGQLGANWKISQG